MARKTVANDRHSEQAGGASNSLIDEHPYINDGGAHQKRTLRLSGTGVLRRREPTNEYIASKFTNFVFDHSKQLPVVPDTDPRVAVEASTKTGNAPYRTMNRNGHPFAIAGDFVGGSPDTRGNPFGKPKALSSRK